MLPFLQAAIRCLLFAFCSILAASAFADGKHKHRQRWMRARIQTGDHCVCKSIVPLLSALISIKSKQKEGNT